LVRRHRRAGHHQLGDDRRNEAGDDEAWSPGRFGDEHHAGQWHAVPRAEERRDTDDGEERCVELVECASDDAAHERARHHEGDEEATDTAAGNRRRRRHAAQDEDRGNDP
jgi:hypothetical protein